MIRLISAGLLLACSLAAPWVARRWLPSPATAVPGGLGTAGRVITGLVQVACLAAVALVVAATLRRPRFRLLAGLAAGAVAAAILAKGILASTVLLYRLATYWLPVPPGWYSWRLLQRMDYV